MKYLTNTIIPESIFHIHLIKLKSKAQTSVFSLCDFLMCKRLYFKKVSFRKPNHVSKFGKGLSSTVIYLQNSMESMYLGDLG